MFCCARFQLDERSAAARSRANLQDPVEPIYMGEIHHKGQIYKGRHEAIVPCETWHRVQHHLQDNTQGEQRSGRSVSPSLLAGRVVDEEGQPLVASHACRKRCATATMSAASSSMVQVQVQKDGHAHSGS
jgi:hypothetical protein